MRYSNATLKRILFLVYAIFIVVTLPAQFGPFAHIANSDIHNPERVKALDVDNDGDTDLIVASNASLRFVQRSRYQLLLLRNQGSGTFAPFEVIDSTANDVQEFELADLDMDGDLDIVATSQTIAANYIGRTFWYEHFGNGLYGPATLISEEEFQDDLLAVGDVDGDGDPDVIDGGNGLNWSENDGQGLFPTSHSIQGGSSSSATLVDVDGDSDLDVVYDPSGINGELPLRVARNDGAGNFTVIGNAIGQTGFSPTAFAPLNTDAAVDMITIGAYGRGFSSYLNNGTGQFTLAMTIDADAWFFDLADMDGDGRKDILGGEVDGTIGWWRSLGTGQFATFTPLDILRAGSRSCLHEDINGDGLKDLLISVVPDDQVMVHMNTGGNVYSAGSPMFYAMSMAQTMVLEDMDADGDNDLAIALGSPDRVVWRANDGTGNWGPEQLFATADGAVGRLDAKDVDGDGDIDLLYSTASGVSLILNDGNGTQTSAVLATPISETFSPTFEVADVDQDGDMDILIAGCNTPDLQWWMNDGIPFTAGPLVASGTGCVDELRAQDLNMDGVLDIAWGSWNLPMDSIVLLFGEGSGNYSAPMALDSADIDGGALLAHDLDGDGDPELISSDSYFTLMWRNDGNGSFTRRDTIARHDGGTHTTRFTDVDQDGDLDLVTAGFETRWYENLGDLQFGTGFPIDVPLLVVHGITLGDVDANGFPDLICVSQSESTLGWLPNLFDETVRLEGQVYFDVDSNGVADPGEQGMGYVQIIAQPNGTGAMTNEDGEYSMFVHPGTYTLQMEVLNENWELSTDSMAYNVTVSSSDAVIDGLDFGIQWSIGPPALTATLSMGQDGCNTIVPLQIGVMQLGTNPVSATIQVVLDPSFTYESSTFPPDSVVGNVMHWSFLDLLPGDHLNWTVQVHSPNTDMIGEPYAHVGSLVATNIYGEDSLLSFAFNGTVSCGYDPNMKQVVPVGAGEAGYVDIQQRELEYTIHFQNTGNDTAHSVVLRDQLDPRLVPSSLQILGRSHPFELTVDADGEMAFTFPEIMLPDSGTDQLASRGHVSFRIDIWEDLASGTLITNTASIYFDNNPPIWTNTVNTTLWDCSLVEAEIIMDGPYEMSTNEAVDYQWSLNGEEIPGAMARTLTASENGDYTVTITDSMGCVATSSAVTILGSSVAEQRTMSISARPNPFRDQCELTFPQAIDEGTQVCLLDLMGRTRLLTTGNGTSSLIIQRNALASGIYFLQLRVKGQPTTELKLIVL